MGKRIALIVYLALPFFIIALLMWMIAGSLQRQAQSSPPASAEPTSFVAERAPMMVSEKHARYGADTQPEAEAGARPERLDQGFIIVVDDPQRLGGTNPAGLLFSAGGDAMKEFSNASAQVGLTMRELSTGVGSVEKAGKPPPLAGAPGGTC